MNTGAMWTGRRPKFPSIAMSLFTAILCVAMLASTGAVAQVDSREGIALQNQIYQLRQEIQNLRDQVAHGGGGSNLAAGRGGAVSPSGNDMVAQLLTRVDTLEDQARQLRGKADELQNQLDRQNAELGKRIDDLAFQMNAHNPASLGTPAQPGDLAATAPVQPPLVAPPLAATPRVRTPELAMQEGNAALARRDYPAAEQAAREVVAVKASPRAYDGQFLLAQALFGQRQFSDAAIAYDDTYKRSRKGAHAQDALLGLAKSLAAINEKKAACGTLEKLHAEFPQSRADLRDGIATATQRAACR